MERKAVCFGSGAGVLDENGVIPDQDINEGSLKMDALALTQHVGRCVERKDVDGRISIRVAVLGTMNPRLFTETGRRCVGGHSQYRSDDQPDLHSHDQRLVRRGVARIMRH